MFGYKDLGLIHKVLEMNKGKTRLLEKFGLWIHVNEIAQAVVAVEFWEETGNISSQLANNSATIKFFPCSAATNQYIFHSFWQLEIGLFFYSLKIPGDVTNFSELKKIHCRNYCYRL